MWERTSRQDNVTSEFMLLELEEQAYHSDC
jgi:hypothetical protein